jgi:hypothetical protein
MLIQVNCFPFVIERTSRKSYKIYVVSELGTFKECCIACQNKKGEEIKSTKASGESDDIL